MEGQVLELASMFVLSLWKVYIAYGYFAYGSFSFVVASLVVSTAVVFANLLSKEFYIRMQHTRWFVKFKSSKGYVRGEEFYKKYGFYLSMLLAPTLLGIPTISLVSLAMNVDNKRVIAGLLISNILWGGVIYLSFHYSLGLFDLYATGS